MDKFASWYTADPADPCLEPAREAYTLAVERFSTGLTADPSKREAARKTCSPDALKTTVEDAALRYEASHRNKSAHKWTLKLSKRIVHYQNVMDVIVQHHPEYVSLAWGAMKFLFVAVVNHENLLSSLAKGLALVGEALPRVELAAVLYPTTRMKQALAELYAHIIRFLIRARDWFEERKPLRILHSVTRPAELRYDDLIDEIDSCSRNVVSLAVSAAQAEQRDMHTKLQVMLRRQEHHGEVLMEVRQLVSKRQSMNLNASGYVNTNPILSDQQFDLAMTNLSTGQHSDPEQRLGACTFLRNRRRLNLATTVDPFWLTPKMKEWGLAQTSSLILVQGSFQNRAAIQDFCVDVIEVLRKAAIPVVWALNPQVGASADAFTMAELLKHLTYQVLKINSAARKESALACCFANVRDGQGEQQWFDVFCASLGGLRQLHIVIDIELLGSISRSATDFSLSSAFLTLFQKLKERNLRTIVKVVLVTGFHSQ
ncbi:uncharacterized protein LTHEOB_5260 [Lasiodiplodia theobromae]|uniref:uncharacterized protein n=1 Tax=Lasiodiplodia theobromae TaxID=45133 RepID=UPI0015C3AF80|nr:uncharacterized protein LTHEOB_5260 [Lasiodiplodia theobromae]KAF4545427.1 hypothetical protein LTHEOB_5260 [Lasiodiplodia theobromae]